MQVRLEGYDGGQSEAHAASYVAFAVHLLMVTGKFGFESPGSPTKEKNSVAYSL